MKISGNILKMRSTLDDTVKYSLPIGGELLDMNPLVGKKVKLTFSGQINCLDTNQKIKKTYGQGYSYKSFMSLARCDMCIVKPELCHFSEGTCREPEWGKKNCFIPHYIYLANSSGVKIGITRETQVPTRWIDQGATQALPILKVEDRLTSGIIESEIKKDLADKTNWRKMLQGIATEQDLYEVRDQIFEDYGDLLDEYNAIDLDEEIVNINYPVLEYPEKVSSLSFDKKNIIEGTLKGIKGQYLIFDIGVINIRKHQGYFIDVES